ARDFNESFNDPDLGLIAQFHSDQKIGATYRDRCNGTEDTIRIGALAIMVDRGANSSSGHLEQIAPRTGRTEISQHNTRLRIHGLEAAIAQSQYRSAGSGFDDIARMQKLAALERNRDGRTSCPANDRYCTCRSSHPGFYDLRLRQGGSSDRQPP